MLRSILVLLMFSTHMYAGEKENISKTEGPVAKLVGPEKAKIGQQLKFTTEGSVGDDIKFSISPPTVNFEPVKLLDGKDTAGIIFTPPTAGTYYIYQVLNSSGKTAFSVHTLVVEGAPTVPIVPTVPDKSYFDGLSDAIKLDTKNDAQTPQYIAQLESLFSRWEELGIASASWEQFQKTFADAASATIGDKIPNSRRVIKDYINKRLPRDPSYPYNLRTINTVAAEILQTIKLSK